MIKWQFYSRPDKDILNPSAKIVLALDILEMRYNISDGVMKDLVESINDKNIKIFQGRWEQWLNAAEDIEVHTYGNNTLFNPIGLALVRRTFPSLMANQIVGVQAMSTPVGLAYSMRVFYEDVNEPKQQ